MLDEWNKMQQIEEINVALNKNIQQNTTIVVNGDDKEEILLGNGGVICKYNNEIELPKDGINQFDGQRIYDENEFLTSLLIQAHLIDPKFQSECRKIFTNNNIVNGNDEFLKFVHFTHGNVKVKDRCIVKARHGMLHCVNCVFSFSLAH